MLYKKNQHTCRMKFEKKDMLRSKNRRYRRNRSKTQIKKSLCHKDGKTKSKKEETNTNTETDRKTTFKTKAWTHEGPVLYLIETDFFLKRLPLGHTRHFLSGCCYYTSSVQKHTNTSLGPFRRIYFGL